MSGYYASTGSNESLHESDFSSLKSIKTGSNASSESEFSNWSEPIPIVDEYEPYSKVLRNFHKNDDSGDEPVAPVTLIAPNVIYETADPHFDLNRASTSSEPFPTNQSPRTPIVGTNLSSRSKSSQRRSKKSKGIITNNGQRVKYGTRHVRGWTPKNSTPKEKLVRRPAGVGRGF
jgi:hypothetical protein